MTAFQHLVENTTPAKPIAEQVVDAMRELVRLNEEQIVLRHTYPVDWKLVNALNDELFDARKNFAAVLNKAAGIRVGALMQAL